MRITFGIAPRRVWRFERCGMAHRLARHIAKDEDGVCVWDKKYILVRADRPMKKDLENVIHESAHAAGWILSESWVRTFAQDLTRLLWRDGWRRIE